MTFEDKARLVLLVPLLVLGFWKYSAWLYWKGLEEGFERGRRCPW